MTVFKQRTIVPFHSTPLAEMLQTHTGFEG